MHFFVALHVARLEADCRSCSHKRHEFHKEGRDANGCRPERPRRKVRGRRDRCVMMIEMYCLGLFGWIKMMIKEAMNTEIELI